jgi:Putative transposase of IS4/5 family (DUF4096)
MDDAAEDAAIILALRSSVDHRKMRLDCLPLLIVKPEIVRHESSPPDELESQRDLQFNWVQTLKGPFDEWLARIVCFALRMWTDENRAKYNRDHLRYPGDVTGGEWARIKPLKPEAKHGGRKREADMREVLNGVMYVTGTGCQWRYPKDLPPQRPAAQNDGTLDRIHHVLYLTRAVA